MKTIYYMLMASLLPCNSIIAGPPAGTTKDGTASTNESPEQLQEQRQKEYWEQDPKWLYHKPKQEAWEQEMIRHQQQALHNPQSADTTQHQTLLIKDRPERQQNKTDAHQLEFYQKAQRRSQKEAKTEVAKQSAERADTLLTIRAMYKEAAKYKARVMKTQHALEVAQQRFDQHNKKCLDFLIDAIRNLKIDFRGGDPNDDMTTQMNRFTTMNVTLSRLQATKDRMSEALTLHHTKLETLAESQKREEDAILRSINLSTEIAHKKEKADEADALLRVQLQSLEDQAKRIQSWIRQAKRSGTNPSIIEAQKSQLKEVTESMSGVKEQMANNRNNTLGGGDAQDADPTQHMKALSAINRQTQKSQRALNTLNNKIHQIEGEINTLRDEIKQEETALRESVVRHILTRCQKTSAQGGVGASIASSVSNAAMSVVER